MINQKNNISFKNKEIIQQKIKIKPIKYFYILASEEFLLKHEPIEEMLRERSQYTRRTKISFNHWILEKPNFINIIKKQHPQIKIPKNPVVIVSTDKLFIVWLKLRINNVFMGQFLSPTKEIPNPLK
ncbi:unnamed protein product [Choristocarpus tenellus]|uniref:hypothetical protein n=1 Tax=Choristocarpus tenellus TaxID=116065 RepID=UPI002E77087A|nr:hypothetical protein V2478_pgp058 [Choristocarpus tenellus]WAM62357.1 hypothetical protein [Choristocarpus tenellus]